MAPNLIQLFTPSALYVNALPSHLNNLLCYASCIDVWHNSIFKIHR